MAIKDARQYLQEKLDKENFSKLSAIANDKLEQFIADSIELAKPAKVSRVIQLWLFYKFC
ncbi:MAG: hypothetical protein ABIL62_17765 [Planctomycetota bacterium]|nr:hypothetical protein [Planctomycetota bacterium]MBU1518095.1 hypothetical protein [Planctomycetota bacterium]MBU2457797.1 hypothetical protein [Planctomycetota bacterium]MBU2596833.1 hypothetical protein [Planctomycetota bacterium]